MLKDKGTSRSALLQLYTLFCVILQLMEDIERARAYKTKIPWKRWLVETLIC